MNAVLNINNVTTVKLFFDNVTAGQVAFKVKFIHTNSEVTTLSLQEKNGKFYTVVGGAVTKTFMDITATTMEDIAAEMKNRFNTEDVQVFKKKGI